MTISSTTRKAGPFNGNGSVTAFPFTFRVFGVEDLKVVQADTAAAVETLKVLNTDYGVSINADQETSPGGVVTMVVAPPFGQTITLSTQIANLQPTSLIDGGAFRADVVMAAFDRMVMLIQQLQEQTDRSFKTAFSSPLGPGADLANYVALAKGHADNAGASEDAALGSELAAAASALLAGLEADAATAAALAAVTPTGVVLAEFLDRFYPLGSLVAFDDIYSASGMDFGGVDPTSVFPNEGVSARVTLSAGSVNYDLGLLV